MEKQKITVKELSVLMWLKLLQDFKDIEATALVDKIREFPVEQIDIEQEFFADTVDKFMDMGLMTYDSLSEEAYKCAERLLGIENTAIKIKSSFKEICQFVKDNKEEILKISISILKLALE